MAHPPAANNGQDCDNACQLAKAINKTGVQSLNNPCTIVGWYAASAAVGSFGVVAANAGAVGEWAITEGVNWGTQQWIKLLWKGARPGAGIIAVTKSYGKLAWNTSKSACNAMQP